jgi:hypothetical protein
MVMVRNWIVLGSISLSGSINLVEGPRRSYLVGEHLPCLVKTKKRKDEKIMIETKDKELLGLIRRGLFLDLMDQVELVKVLSKAVREKDPFWACRIHSEGVSSLLPKDQKTFTSLWVKAIKENHSLHQEVFSIVGKGFDSSAKLKNWIESRLEKDLTLTPKRVAYECRYYKRLKREMDPYLVHLARKIKNKLLARRRRNLEGNLLESDWPEENNEGVKGLSSLDSEDQVQLIREDNVQPTKRDSKNGEIDKWEEILYFPGLQGEEMGGVQ